MKNIDGNKFKELILAAADWINKNREVLNKLNVFPVPDGDTGTNMSLTLQDAVEELKKLDGNLSDIAKTAANSTLMNARGCSGIILSQWFKGFAQSIEGKEKIDSSELADAFQTAAGSAYKAVKKPVEGTILTVTRECADKAQILAEEECGIIMLFEETLLTAKESLARTPELLPILKEAGVVDAGAQGFVFMLEAMLNSLQGRELKSLKIKPVQNILETIKIKKEKLINKYCTECVIERGDSKLEQIKTALEKYGDSLIIAKSSGLIRIHMHTNIPKKVLKLCSGFGKVTKPKIDNMKKQRKGFLSFVKGGEPIKKKKKEIGIIAVTLGRGILKIFRSMGADVVIAGRQTMNPSTKDFIKAIKKVNAETHIILPNNNNALFAAEEVKKTSSQPIYIIPTKTIPQGISSLLAFNEEFDLTANIDNMSKAFRKIKSGSATCAVGKGKYKQLIFKRGDVLGFWEEELNAVGKDVYEVTLDLIKRMIGTEDKLISLFYGKYLKPEEAEKLIKIIKSQYPNLEVQCYFGGQPHYYYFISIE